MQCDFKERRCRMYGNLKRGEDTEQMGVIDWTEWNTGRFPELKLLFHIPNGGKRDAKEAARFKAMGVKAGVPDLCLPVPRGGYAGLYIEMKYGKNKTTDQQKEWIQNLTRQGYLVKVCWGGEAATAILEEYLQQGRTIMIDPLDSWNMTEATDCMKSALAVAAVQGTCPFGKDFESEYCLPSPEIGGCAMCVNKYMQIWLEKNARRFLSGGSSAEADH